MSSYTSKLIFPKGRRRSSRVARSVRAIWRDTSALLREFREPLLIFLGVSVIGGLIYGELHYGVYGQRLPYIELPYIMVALMILESPLDIPAAPQLLFFWYIMPVVAIYIVGRGASDFVRLFFNRDERRDAWEEAVASTYRNHIIVMGVGHVGLRIVRKLVEYGFEIVCIDNDAEDPVYHDLNRLEVPLVTGDGRSPEILEKAGVRYAQAFLACTSDDSVNLESIIRARHMNDRMRIVARMWDDDLSVQMRKFLRVDVVLSASDLAAPAFAGNTVGIEITQTLRIHDVEYSMIKLTVEPNSFMDGYTVGEFQQKYRIDIVLHENAGQVEVHPPAHLTVNAGDTIVIFARHDQIVDVVARNQRGIRG